MINYPITYHRDFRHDFPPANQEVGTVALCQRVALAALPLLSMHRSFRGPLSLGMSCMRTITHVSQMLENFKKGDIQEGAFHLLHASLATSAVALFFFNPILCFLTSSVSDFIINFRTCVEKLQEGNYQAALEALAFMSLDLLFLGSFCYGSIEITVACMIMQILLDLHQSAQHFKKGNYLEGMCQTLLAGARMHQIIPQLKILQWKWNYNPVLTAELKQDARGFVYLDIPDEYVHALHALYKEAGAELPPYFGKGMAGAHVSIILSDEMHTKPGLALGDIGKKMQFRIVHADSVKPEGWKGVDKVSFITLSCPEAESLRTRCGLSPRISDHDFHLTFSITKAPATAIA